MNLKRAKRFAEFRAGTIARNEFLCIILNVSRDSLGFIPVTDHVKKVIKLHEFLE